jgi:hypothetical protein
MKHFLILLIILVFTSCERRYQPIGNFNLRPGTLKEGERLKLVFAITGDTDNKTDQYYNHLIAVSHESGDTFNILIPVNHGLTEGDSNKVFTYFTPDSRDGKLVLLDPEDFTSVAHIDSLEISFPKYHKVIFDSKYASLLNNNFPTVKGSIGIRN